MEKPARAAADRQHRALVQTSEGARLHDVAIYTRDRVIDDVPKRYAPFRAVRRIS